MGVDVADQLRPLPGLPRLLRPMLRFQRHTPAAHHRMRSWPLTRGVLMIPKTRETSDFPVSCLCLVRFFADPCSNTILKVSSLRAVLCHWIGARSGARVRKERLVRSKRIIIFFRTSCAWLLLLPSPWYSFACYVTPFDALIPVLSFLALRTFVAALLLLFIYQSSLCTPLPGLIDHPCLARQHGSKAAC